jgi:hypothetical protein
VSIYVFALVILGMLAISDLIVGVSNDAVNFLNSSIGSKAAPKHIIMIIASLGMLAGVTFLIFLILLDFPPQQQYLLYLNLWEQQ